MSVLSAVCFRRFSSSSSKIANLPAFVTNPSSIPLSDGYPEYVRIVEVGARDGLQNEKKSIATSRKIELIDSLANIGLPAVEATAFVSPKWVPQMSDHKEIMSHLRNRSQTGIVSTDYPVLTPNLKGLESALSLGAKEVAIFTAASDEFNLRNTNVTVDESIERYKDVVSLAIKSGAKVRGYVSCVLGCPFTGDVKPSEVVRVVTALKELGCYEVSLGDTIGAGGPGSTISLLDTLDREGLGPDGLAVHFHDSSGQALGNTLIALQRGISVVDSSIAGLGGCPYSPGATGNLATEDLIYALSSLGIATRKGVNGVDSVSNLGYINILDAVKVGNSISSTFGRSNISRAAAKINSQIK